MVKAAGGSLTFRKRWVNATLFGAVNVEGTVTELAAGLLLIPIIVNIKHYRGGISHSDSREWDNKSLERSTGPGL